MSDVTAGRVRVEREAHVAVITIDRPDKLNAMTVAMDAEMNRLVFDLNQEVDVRAVVLTGAGERAFCAGSDIGDLDSYGDNWEYRNRFDAHKDYARAIWQLRKPVVAAIRGYCIGGGLEMACASDVRIGSPDSSFAAGEIRLGWHGGSGATQLLTHLLGPGDASLLLLTGDRMAADEALRVGLLQRVVAPNEVVEVATALARRIAELAPIAVQRTKYMVRVAQNVPLEAGLLVENDSFAYCMLTEDAAEGRRAFAEKRSPEFRGR